MKVAPIKAAKTLFGKPVDAWWYEDRHHITVHIQTANGVASCKITRAPLADWIKRSKPRAPAARGQSR